MPNPTITINPNPPVAGKKATITYTGPKQTTLTLEWDPEAQPNSVLVGSSGTVTIVVPANATSLVISDPVNGAASLAVMVSP